MKIHIIDSSDRRKFLSHNVKKKVFILKIPFPRAKAQKYNYLQNLLK